jgi:hypothetical protein
VRGEVPSPAPRSPWLIAVLLVLATSAHTQVFRVQGGISTMFNAEGASLDVKGPNYDTNFGAGFLDGRFVLGGFVRSQRGSYTILSGDNNVSFSLPTDVFDTTHYFSARGFGVSRTTSSGGFYGFLGMTSTWFGTGFFQAAQSDTPVGVLFYDRRLKPDLHFYSRDIVSTRQTSLQALEWEPRKSVKASVAAGLGSNQAYMGTSLTLERSDMTLKLGYTVEGERFRRITVVTPLTSEVDRENLEFTYHPNSFFSLAASHNNLLQPIDSEGQMVRVAVNEALANFSLAKLYFGLGIFQSRYKAAGTFGSNIYVGHRFGHRLETNFNYFESRPEKESKTKMMTLSLREALFQRFSLLQLISRSEGQTTASFGGQVITNRFNAEVDYQNVYLPLRPDHPFQQALAVNASFRILGPLQLTAASNIAADGRMRYTFGLATFLYRSQGMVAWQRDQTYAFPKFLIQGIVKDDQGTPIQGAAVHLAAEVVYSDDEGKFLLRTRKRQAYSLQVALDEFMTNEFFEVVKAPTTVWAEPETNPERVEILLRRVHRPVNQPTTVSSSSTH